MDAMMPQTKLSIDYRCPKILFNIHQPYYLKSQGGQSSDSPASLVGMYTMLKNKSPAVKLVTEK